MNSWIDVVIGPYEVWTVLRLLLVLSFAITAWNLRKSKARWIFYSALLSGAIIGYRVGTDLLEADVQRPGLTWYFLFSNLGLIGFVIGVSQYFGRKSWKAGDRDRRAKNTWGRV